MSILEFTEADLKAATQQGEQPVLVYFVSAHCAPCKMLTPLVEELAVEWAAVVQVAKFDVLAHMLTALQYRVMSAPELILFKNGQQVARIHGYVPKHKLLEKFMPFLDR
jgi:thioredoxin 1